MLGKMIQRIRKDRGITKTKLSELTDINIGHLTHIEKGERNPSHHTLMSICSSLNVPYQNLYLTYDRSLSQEQLEYDYQNYISYNKIPCFDNISDFIDCPVDHPRVSFAVKNNSVEMEPFIKQGSTIYIEQNASLEHKDIGLFYLNGEYHLRRLMFKKGKFVLKADNKELDDINIKHSDDFTIIGKVYF